LQECMHNLVGIIRTESELTEALGVIEQLKSRLANVTVHGNRHFNPGWHLALDLQTMLTVSDAATRSALLRKESRGGHTREDFPTADADWGTVNVVTRRRSGGELEMETQPLSDMPADLKQLFEEKH